MNNIHVIRYFNSYYKVILRLSEVTYSQIHPNEYTVNYTYKDNSAVGCRTFNNAQWLLYKDYIFMLIELIS